eukprot:16147436-Heterocapsa_arctica.AAC.1
MDPSATELEGLISLDAVFAWAALSPELAAAVKVAFGATGAESPRLFAILPELEYPEFVDAIRLGEAPAPLLPIQRAGVRLVWRVCRIAMGVQKTDAAAASEALEAAAAALSAWIAANSTPNAP